MRHDLTFDECEKILLAGHYGHLGCVEDGEPYVLPVTYVYENGYLYSHTKEGRKIDMMRKSPHICLQVENVRSGYDWESVICWGDYEEITDPEQIRQINLLLAEQYAQITQQAVQPPVSPLVQDLTKREHDERKSVVYRLNLRRTTGKAERPQ